MENNLPAGLTPKEAYEQRRAAKRQSRLGQSQNQPAQTANRWPYYLAAAIIVLLALSGWWLFNQKPANPDFSQAVPIQNREHIEVGAEHPAHNSNPPTSGWHYGDTAPLKFYDEPVADEYLIHNLEHGDIWIAYQPRLSQTVKDGLKTLTSAGRVIITPREANDTDLALAAWGRLDKFDLEGDTLPLERIKDFIKRYQNRGPEQVPPNRG